MFGESVFGQAWKRIQQEHDQDRVFLFSDAGDLPGWDHVHTELTYGVPSTLYIDTYVSRVKEAHKRRETLRYAERIAALALDPGSSPDAGQAEAAKLAIMEDGEDQSVTDSRNMMDVVDALLDRMERNDLEALWPMPSMGGVNGLEEGMVAYLAAPDGTGKTLLAEVAGEGWARAGWNVGMFHLELNKLLMLKRTAARNFGLDANAKSYSPQDVELLRSVPALFEDMPGEYKLIHSPGWSIERICRRAEVLGLDIVIVDYLQKVNGFNTSMGAQSDWASDAKVIEYAKNWAERTGKRVLFLGQITKDGKDGEEPMIRHIRGSAEITDKCNQVFIAWRPIAEDTILGKDGSPIQVQGGKSAFMYFKMVKNTMGPEFSPKQWYVDGPRFNVVDANSIATMRRDLNDF